MERIDLSGFDSDKELLELLKGSKIKIVIGDKLNRETIYFLKIYGIRSVEGLKLSSPIYVPKKIKLSRIPKGTAHLLTDVEFTAELLKRGYYEYPTGISKLNTLNGKRVYVEHGYGEIVEGTFVDHLKRLNFDEIVLSTNLGYTKNIEVKEIKSIILV